MADTNQIDFSKPDSPKPKSSTVGLDMFAKTLHKYADYKNEMARQGTANIIANAKRISRQSMIKATDSIYALIPHDTE